MSRTGKYARTDNALSLIFSVNIYLVNKRNFLTGRGRVYFTQLSATSEIIVKLREYERIFKALSDKQRLRILALLTQSPLVVNDIKTVLKLSMSTVSQHLSILREADLLLDNKQGRWVIYSIHPDLKKTDTLSGAIYKELSKHFDSDDILKADKDSLSKMHIPLHNFAYILKS